MLEELDPIQVGGIEPQEEPTLEPTEQLEVLLEEEQLVEEVVVEKKPTPKKSTKVKGPEVHKVRQIIQKRPSTYCLDVVGKGQVIVHKSKFNRGDMTVEL